MIYAGSASNDDPAVIEECSRLEDVLGVEITSAESLNGGDDAERGAMVANVECWATQNQN